MGIFCQINLFKPPDGAYLPGQVVSGLINYAVDEPMEFERITTSLKGAGFVLIEVQRNKQTHSYRSSQVYVDVDNIVQDSKIISLVGSYDIKFNFVLPLNIPSSLYYYKRLIDGTVKCSIKYYTRIKFERPGFFSFNKHFKKEITVIAGATPKLLREPVIHGETKALMQLFSSKPNNVNIKATILNSVIPIGGKINIHYEISNNSSVVIKSIETKLVERYIFNAAGYKDVRKEKTVPGTEAKTTSINRGDVQCMPVEINVPSDRHSLENSDIVSREYLVRIEAALPIPHRNAVLNIPIQIEIVNNSIYEDIPDSRPEGIEHDDTPPSYWEAMGETKKDSDDFEK